MSLRRVGILAVLVTAGCSDDWGDTRFDHGLDHKSLSELAAQVWVDPDGCDHWIIDDGLEGYMTPRVRPDGTPVCRPGAVPETVVEL